METLASLKEDAARYRRLLAMGTTDPAVVVALTEMVAQCERRTAALTKRRADAPTSFR